MLPLCAHGGASSSSATTKLGGPTPTAVDSDGIGWVLLQFSPF